jgi:bifunctional non-homologous end joining protein LigD
MESPSDVGLRHPDLSFTNLDQPLFEEANATKRDLIEYLEAVADLLLPELIDRPVSVIRVRPGQAPFMQKNIPKGAPGWLTTVSWWAEASQRNISYVLCNDLRSLLWFGNQRAVEYHATLVTASAPEVITSLVVDLDPPQDAPFSLVVRAAHLVRSVLQSWGLDAAIKTSGSKGLHLYTPITPMAMDDAAAALRAIAAQTAIADPDIATIEFIKADRGGRVFIDPTRTGWSTVACAYSPRIRPDATVSFPIEWSELDDVDPHGFTVRTVPTLLASHSPWRDLLPQPASIPTELIEQGRAIPILRAKAMHEGKRRATARKRSAAAGDSA